MTNMSHPSGRQESSPGIADTTIAPVLCRLVFYGDTTVDQPREVALERLRLLLKDTPARFQSRMNRMPIVLLGSVNQMIARRYQQALIRKGIICRIEPSHRDTTTQHPNPFQNDCTRDPSAPSGDQPGTSFSLPSPSHFGPVRNRSEYIRFGLGFCLNPRGFIRRILSHVPYRITLIIAAAVGLAQALAMIPEDAGDGSAIMMHLLIIALLAPPMGILLVYIRGFLLFATGRLLNGHADGRDIRTALAWSEIPLLLGGGLGLAEIALSGWVGRVHSLPTLLGQTGVVLLQLGIGIWALVLLLHTVAEIQAFSIGRALTSIAMAIGMVALPAVSLYAFLVAAGILAAG